MNHRQHHQPQKQHGLYLDASNTRRAAPCSASPPHSKRRSRPDSFASCSTPSPPLWLGGGGGGDSARHQQLTAASILLSRGGGGGGVVVGGGAARSNKAPTSSSSSASFGYNSSTRQYYNNDDAEADATNGPSTTTTTTTTALTLARQAPIAGYLQKLGQSVRQFKRRFFVLQPTTTLYYFLSPDDVEPRGCLDLEGATIVPRFQTEHGIYQFAIQWPRNYHGDHHDASDEPPIEILLEARSEADAQQWIHSLQNERMDVVTKKYQKTQLLLSGYKSRVAELEKLVQQYKLVEADRDGALDDAAQWKLQLERLDHGIRQYAREINSMLLVPPTTATRRTITTNSCNNTVDNKAFMKENGGDHRLGKDDDDVPRKEDKSTSNGEIEHSDDKVGDDTDDTNGVDIANDKDSAASSCTPSQEDDGTEKLDPTDVPGRHFGTLWNTIEQMKENFVLASDEAASAVQDLHQAQMTVQTLEKRMAQAETHLCKIWEENCELRKTIKQHKREKRLLINEVKNLREQQQQQLQLQQKKEDDDDDNNDYCNNDEEQRLLADIEAHVQTSIQLQRELVGRSHRTTKTTTRYTAKIEDTDNILDTSGESEGSLLRGIVGSTLRLSCGPSTLDVPCSKKNTKQPTTTNVPVIASLLDSDDDDDDDSDSSSASSSGGNRRVVQPRDIDACSTTDEDYSQRSNPIDKLDEIELNDDDHDEPPRLIAVSSSSTTQSSRPTAPTSQLSCPLADVVSSKADNTRSTVDGEVYHLTFYSQKIGLQFQKVPPPPAKASGLLTEAMTADLARVSSAGEKTAAELRRIANISGTAKSDSENALLSCPVAKPIDAVLVCGFVGFDDSSSDNKRPKLGARLVAFDGVSLEAGAWTFQSVRKAIQARRRPLTLSFRNDFLTTTQRKILTKAVKDVENLSPSAGASDKAAEPVSGRSSASAFQRSSQIDEASSTTGSSIGRGHHSGSSAGSFSKLRSFSEAGSSVSVLSAVGPLVSNLLGQRRGPFTPEYLRRPPVSIEESPQHLDFKSELL